MVMSAELKALFDKAKVPESFVAYLDGLGVEDSLTFALLADSETAVKSELIKESGVQLGPMEVVAVKKAWLWSRAEVPDPSKGSSSSSSSAPAPKMPPGTERGC